jgi:SAM-dependent methyltransferase
MPNDEDEQTRLQILHEVYLSLFDYKLTQAPILNPQKILDIGTGTGEWAMAAGDEWPNAEVIGTDIAKIQPTAVPLNVFFEIDDAEEEGGWTWPEDEFDLIHLRSMVGAFKNWRYIYEEAYKHLKPGGWIEVLDFDDHKVFLTYFDENSGVFDWLKALRTAAAMSGRPRSVAHLEPENLTELGYMEAATLEKVIPMGIWPNDKEDQRLGKHFLVAQISGIEALSLRPLTEQLGWDVNEVYRMGRVVSEKVMELATDAEKAKGLGFKVKVLIGRKPFPGEEDGEQQDASSEGDSGRTITMENVNGQPVGDIT